MRTVRQIQTMMTPQKSKLRVAAYARVSDSRLHALMPQDQDIYQKKYSNLVERHDALVSEIESIEKQLFEAACHQKDLKEFLETLNQQSELISEFDELLWESVVDKVEICQNRIVTFTLKNGSEVVA